MDTIKFPLSFQNGSFVKIEDNTDEYWSQMLAMLVRIQNGELPLEPTYGINDPVFSTIDSGRIKLGASRFYPEIEILGVTIGRANSEGIQNIQVNFSY